MAVSLSLFGDPHLEEVAEPRLHTYLPAKMNIGIIAALLFTIVVSYGFPDSEDGIPEVVLTKIPDHRIQLAALIKVGGGNRRMIPALHCIYHFLNVSYTCAGESHIHLRSSCPRSVHL